ncbi:hypothetical protein K493DRAFT_212395 [Basidiobolus meristosporus CBS 931.73]|uniref:ABC transporter domain-containing protein n=1 Tax=Basidiobolus meristosporus CBS 931.73 TaxID=1314790 RepID=A0A1Y1YNL6_9FUNG|nr:hypothetical protein K493DRAFT_212395 [Basidiobolus meristosporus CBS 931.73]|eukprot:ORX99568.1 hypothetical protein K493DRAFT_212395 [Basidiobolus meristosporus CBS 931.73]
MDTGTCSCIPGFGGIDCGVLACNSSSTLGISRELAPSNGGVCNTCDEGFTGLNCNICTTNYGCSSQPQLYKPLTTGEQMACNTKPEFVHQSYLQCPLTDPSLLSLYPGDVQMAFTRNITGYSYAQLFWNDKEQFTCHMNQCSQKILGTVEWECDEIKCECMPEAAFCGGAGVSVNIKSMIEMMSGYNVLSCNNDTCTWKENHIKTFFPDGFPLNNCKFGECAYPSELVFDMDTTTAFEISKPVLAVIIIFACVFCALIISCGFAKRTQMIMRRREVPPPATGVNIEWKKLTYEIQLKNRKSTESNKFTILDGISGYASKGQVLAIMGPSGTGKTTLVDILGGKRKSGKVRGSLLVDGRPMSTAEMRQLVGFVDQEFVLSPELTVFESLMFSACLRLPECIPYDQKRARVESLIQKLGLENVRDRRVGSVATRSLSGGEKRRVAIGLELVSEPAILILDEPLSGLDSFSASMVIKILHELAKGPNKTTVILTIHQPRSDIFQMFDNTLVLAKGTTLYFGPPSKAATHFDKADLHCPANYNIADYLLDIALKPELLQKATDYNCDHGRFFSNQIEETKETLMLCESNEVEAQPATAFLTQFYLLSKRNFLVLIRNQGLMLTHFAAAIILGVIVGGLYWQISVDLAGFQSRLGALFFIMAVLAFTALGALGTFLEDRLLFIRERSNGYYKPIPFITSKLLFDLLPLRVIPAILIGTITYWMVGLTSDGPTFARFLLTLVLFNGAAGLFCIAVAACIRGTGVSSLLASIVMLFFMLFGGLLINQNNIPPALSWLQYISMFRYGFQALSVNEIVGLRIIGEMGGIEINIPASTVLVEMFGFSADGIYKNIIILAWYWVILIVIIVILVQFTVKERR